MPTVETVRQYLARVTDPELDRSIVDLGYVDDVRIVGVEVTVDVTLPTAWCSPAFAWMMATDARDEVESIVDVSEARIRLHDHMHDEEITRGVAERRDFAEVFPDADGGVAEIRATLDDKARVARQYVAVETLLDAGLSPAQVCTLDRRDVDLHADSDDDRATVTLDDAGLVIFVDAGPLRRYLDKARTAGLVDGSRGRDPAVDARLFRTPEGDPIAPAEFDLVHARGRLARTNMSGQAGLCDGLNEARRRKLDRDPPETADATRAGHGSASFDP